MAADGSSGPKPWTQRRLSTVFLRVPTLDWPAVKRGLKTEFRAGNGKNAVPQLWSAPTPTLVVGYSVRQGRHDARLLVLEDLWQEPLGAISPESLAREGFQTLADYRRYWIDRERKRFTPTRMVFAYRVRPFREERDRDELADRLLCHLYGEFLTPVAESVC